MSYNPYDGWAGDWSGFMDEIRPSDDLIAQADAYTAMMEAMDEYNKEMAKEDMPSISENMNGDTNQTLLPILPIFNDDGPEEEEILFF